MLCPWARNVRESIGSWKKHERNQDATCAERRLQRMDLNSYVVPRLQIRTITCIPQDDDQRYLAIYGSMLLAWMKSGPDYDSASNSILRLSYYSNTHQLLELIPSWNLSSQFTGNGKVASFHKQVTHNIMVLLLAV